MPFNYDGDGGKPRSPSFRPSEGNWWIKSSTNGAISATHFGVSSDTPVAGDYDGKADVAIWRPSTFVSL